MKPASRLSRTDLPAWKAMAAHAAQLRSRALTSFFDEDPNRAQKFSLEHDSYFLDYSKNHVTDETIRLLCGLARACGLEEKRDAMLTGKPVNVTENRAALHTALRASEDTGLLIDERSVHEDVRKTLGRIEDFVRAVETDKTITDIVNIGIGGSDIGPHMVCEALKPFAQNRRAVHFLSNVDADHFNQILRNLNPKTTFFIVSSKSFTTQETLTNPESARRWAESALGEKNVFSRFAALTANGKAALDFGIPRERVFPFWDWVGGRYSLWSATGLPIALSIGFNNFHDLLRGAESADKHFAAASLERNIPVILGMLGVWHRNFRGHAGHAILPYSQGLQHLPRHMQQLSMESNGKNVDTDGRRVDYDTAPIIFGDAGTNAQHTFCQLLHQGTQIIPCDFILCAKPQASRDDHHDKLLANALAQAQALMQGAEAPPGQPYRLFEGNRPSNIILLHALTPYTLGLLLAFYEHKIFVEGVIWNVNSFDQFGVELGKTLTGDILPAMRGASVPTLDPSTQSIIEKIRDSR